MFFESWQGVVRVLVVGIFAYVALVSILRISGKRTLSKMNAFDLIVTVALGSTLATVLVSKDVPLVEGIAGFAVLVLLQLAVTWCSVRYPFVQKAVKAEPALLFIDGQFLLRALHRERVTREEAEAAVREGGIASTDDVKAIVLETDGTLSIIKRTQSSPNALHSVSGFHDVRNQT